MNLKAWYSTHNNKKNQVVIGNTQTPNGSTRYPQIAKSGGLEEMTIRDKREKEESKTELEKIRK